MDGGVNDEDDLDFLDLDFLSDEAHFSASSYRQSVNNQIASGLTANTSDNYFCTEGRQIPAGIPGSTSDDYFCADVNQILSGFEGIISDKYFCADRQQNVAGIHGSASNNYFGDIQENISDNYFCADVRQIPSGIEGSTFDNYLCSDRQQIAPGIDGSTSNNYFSAEGQQILADIQRSTSGNYICAARRQIAACIQGSTSSNYCTDGQQMAAAIQGSTSNNYVCADGKNIDDIFMAKVDEQIPAQTPNQPNQTMSATEIQLAQEQFAFQQRAEQHLDQQIRLFWFYQYHEVRLTQDFKTHCLPIRRIKRIMRDDENINLISYEAPMLFAKASEMFILELTIRSWAHAERCKRLTLLNSDVACALRRTKLFDFLVDFVPKEETKEEDDISFTDGSADPTCFSPSFYMPPQQGSLGMMTNEPTIDHANISHKMMNEPEIDQAIMMYDQQPQADISHMLWEQQLQQQLQQQQQYNLQIQQQQQQQKLWDDLIHDLENS